MKISSILKKRMSFSFEVFPPKAEQPLEPLLATLDELYKFKPDFISCTYGAGGTNKGRSEELCSAIKNSGNEVMTHFTCVGNKRSEVIESLNEYVALGVENALALRGDIPEGWTGTNGDFTYAVHLIEFMKENFPEICISAACYPEKHVEALSITEDISHLRMKQDAGAEFMVTQMCHDVEAFERFADRAEKAQIHIPIIVGLMPVLSKDGLIRMTLSNGCSIPAELAAIIGKYGDNPEDFKKAGKEYTVKQIHKYIHAGIDGLHIYSLNKHKDIADILNESGIRRNDV